VALEHRIVSEENLVLVSCFECLSMAVRAWLADCMQNIASSRGDHREQHE
jgi:hypothetical protein